MKKLWFLLFIIGFTAVQAYKNSTLDEKYTEERWETHEKCDGGEWTACLGGSALATVSALVGSELRISPAARLRKDIKLQELQQLEEGLTTPAGSPRSGTREDVEEGLFGRLARSGDRFLRTAGLEIELTPELTENGRFQPRFIDEIYSELDTLPLKHAKPAKQYELKKLFIPLLVILKLFKLKLLVLLPIILGLASFKKIIALAVILLPAVIAYFKICKPDLSQSYGSYGHSSYYSTPPNHFPTRYSEDGTAYERMSYRNHGDRIAYRAHR